DGSLRKARFLSHPSCAPMSAIRRHRFQGFGDHILDLSVGDGSRRPRPWLIEQPFQAVDTESFAPLADRCPRDAKPLGHFGVAQSVTAAEHNAGGNRSTDLSTPEPATSSLGAGVLLLHYLRFFNDLR